MIQFGGGTYTVGGQMGELPSSYNHYLQEAELHDDLGIRDSEGRPAFVTVSRQEGWPFLAISLRYRDWVPSLGTLLVPETDLLLVGCDNTLLAYDLRAPSRLWREDVFGGFWRWRRHDDIVLMSGELDFVAYSLKGERLWDAYVEPPWDYTVSGHRLDLDVIGRKSTLSLHSGQPA